MISARHEGNAASMADAYAKSTGELTVRRSRTGPYQCDDWDLRGCEEPHTPAGVGRRCANGQRSNFHIEQAELVRSVGAVSSVSTRRSAREDTLRDPRDTRSSDGGAQPADRCAGLSPHLKHRALKRPHCEPNAPIPSCPAAADCVARQASLNARRAQRRDFRRGSIVVAFAGCVSERCLQHRCVVTGCLLEILGHCNQRRLRHRLRTS